jgi:predicted metal-dependent HD superfamily phosphohydrolase
MSIDLESLETRLLKAWKPIMSHNVGEEGRFSRLLNHYVAKNRAYHNIHHIKSCLDELDELRSIHYGGAMPIDEYMAMWDYHTDSRWQCDYQFEVVELALFYHDVIYDISKNDNEEQSANFFDKEANMGETDWHCSATIYDVERAINATKNHETSRWSNPNGIDGKLNFPEIVVCDIDLAILGASHDKYEEYTNQIRQEYKKVPDEIFYRERYKEMAKFLHRNKIYRHVYFYNKYEEIARENIKQELREIDRITQG